MSLSKKLKNVSRECSSIGCLFAFEWKMYTAGKMYIAKITGAIYNQKVNCIKSQNSWPWMSELVNNR